MLRCGCAGCWGLFLSLSLRSVAAVGCPCDAYSGGEQQTAQTHSHCQANRSSTAQRTAAVAALLFRFAARLHCNDAAVAAELLDEGVLVCYDWQCGP